MTTITEMTTGMNAAAAVALPGRCNVGGVYVDTAEVASLSVEELHDRLSAIEHAEAVLAELQAAVLDEMTRRWGPRRALRIWRDCLGRQ